MITFGHRKKGKVYPIRQAAYGLLTEGDKIALVSTPRGYFLPGGGVEAGEDHEACILREFVEEVGMFVEVKAFAATTRLTSVTPSRNFPIDMMAHCYHVKPTGQMTAPIEDDHTLTWMTLEEAVHTLKLVHQAWVVEVLLRKKPLKTVTAYNKHWPAWFEALSLELTHALEGIIINIEHVGSTSIPGMSAKPIIDMDIIIESMEMFELVKQKLQTLGYRHQGDMGIKEREAFTRDEGCDHDLFDHLPHHLYVCHKESIELARHLRFRDRLRQDPALRQAYTHLKEEIVAKVGPYNEESYVELKENLYGSFFEQILA